MSIAVATELQLEQLAIKHSTWSLWTELTSPIFQLTLLSLTTGSAIVKGFKFPRHHALRNGHNTFFFASNVDPIPGKKANNLFSLGTRDD